MRKVIIMFLSFFMLMGLVYAVSIYQALDFKGASGILNITNITFSDGTVQSTAATGSGTLPANATFFNMGVNGTLLIRNCINYTNSTGTQLGYVCIV